MSESPRGARALAVSTAGFLARHAPFDAAPREALIAFASGATLAYHKAGTVILGPATGAITRLHVIQRGRVTGRIPGAADTERLEFGEGESFPIAAVLGGRATTLEYVAADDTFTYEFEATAVDTLAQAAPSYRAYLAGRLDALVHRVAAQLRADFAHSAIDPQPMARTVGSAIRRTPITCAPGDRLGHGLSIMARERIGAIVVVEADGRPCGIFTERDLVRLAAGGQLDVGARIVDVATRDLVTVPVDALIADAAIAMADRGIRHVLVVDDGRLAGVVSERDLFALQRRTMGQVMRAIALATNDEALARAASEIRTLADNLLAQGVGAESLTRMISALNDRVVRRVLDLEAARHDLTGVRVCWVALGSEGRHEQTFATDQDNAIIFDAGTTPAGVARARLIPFAAAVNRTLDACGFPLCKGNVMASNPDLCLSADEWRQRFGRWMQTPTPEALLNAAILFDFRAIWGEIPLADDLRAWLTAEAPKHRLMLRLLAEDALRTTAPIGFFGDLVAADRDAAPGIDLKLQGTRLFIDVARVYALAHGIGVTGTAARMRESATALRVAAADREAAVDAFHFVLMLRLRQQRRGEGATNRVDPATLNDLERRILKEALRHARSAQRRLELDFVR